MLSVDTTHDHAPDFNTCPSRPRSHIRHRSHIVGATRFTQPHFRSARAPTWYRGRFVEYGMPFR
ncbi:hypothetical protein OH687_14915 [Burkholderia anthina]|nr:hypothetical protein OH687_14915 [Burkholderia anthina]